MKNKLLLLLLLPVLSVKAQSFAKKQIDLNIGIGFGNTFASTATNHSFPPLSASLDIGVTDAISIGGYLGFATASWKYSGSDYCNSGNGNGNYYTYTDDYSWSFYIFGVRGAYHFAEFVKNDKVDLYAGILLGDNYARYNFTTNDPCRKNIAYYGPSYGGFIWAGFIGCRYRFTEKVGAFAEFGYGIAYLNLGVNFKLQ